MAKLYAVYRSDIKFVDNETQARKFPGPHQTEKFNLREILRLLGFKSLQDIPKEQRFKKRSLDYNAVASILEAQDLKFISHWITQNTSGSVFFVDFEDYYFSDPKDALLFKLTFSMAR